MAQLGIILSKNVELKSRAQNAGIASSTNTEDVNFNIIRMSFLISLFNFLMESIYILKVERFFRLNLFCLTSEVLIIYHRNIKYPNLHTEI